MPHLHAEVEGYATALMSLGTASLTQGRLLDLIASQRWQLQPPEAWNEGVVRAVLPGFALLLAAFPPAVEDPEIALCVKALHEEGLTTQEQYDQVWRELADRTEAALGPCSEAGDYLAKLYLPFDPPVENAVLSYRLWRTPHALLYAIQHHEGDSHVASCATVDLRVISWREGTPQPGIPLLTDLIQ